MVESQLFVILLSPGNNDDKRQLKCRQKKTPEKTKHHSRTDTLCDAMVFIVELRLVAAEDA